MTVSNLILSYTDGPALTAASRASCIPTAAKRTLWSGFFYPGRALHIQMSGRISCAVTTPGTGRLDVCLGSAGTTIVFDTLAFNLNVVAKTNVPWTFDCLLVCRVDGATTLTTFFPKAWFASEAVVGSPVNTAGGNGFLNLPVGAPAVGSGCDNTAQQVLDIFWTQTVATGNFQVHNMRVDVVN